MVKKPDSSAQLPLPAVPDRSGARIIPLPLPARMQPEPAAPTARKRQPLWYALYFPQLAELPPAQQRRLLNELADLAQGISATVSLNPQALVCEVRSSLTYFGGIEKLHARIEQPLRDYLQGQELAPKFDYAASPSITGSLLLARAGCQRLVYRRDNLRSALGELPTEVLQLGPEQNRRLYNMGVRYLKDIWRLPMDGIRRRFGSDLVSQLNKALGKAPEPTRNYLPPPQFSSSYELPCEMENLERLLPVVDEMLAQLCDFLQRRDLSSSRLRFFLAHQNRAATEIPLGLRQPSRSREHLLLLLETHFSSLSLPAPVTAIKLEVESFDAFLGSSENLFGPDAAPGQSASNLDQFMEQLQVRLGGQPLKSLDAVAEHCPEYALRLDDYDSPSQRRRQPPAEVSARPRPLWLLAEPAPLTLRQGRLYHRQALTLLNGPERIETRWWSGQDVRRDYYVAQQQDGSRLWIYRERDGERDWFLHGIFA